MSQRDSGYARKERDEYNTPFWVVQTLIPHIPRGRKIWEPACGQGNIVRVLADNGYNVYASDIFDGDDFFNPNHDAAGADGIITNPPYELAHAFIARAIDMMMPSGFICMLLPSDFSYAKSRRELFADCRVFAKKIELTKRIVWFERSDGIRAAPSENHAWYIWDWQHEGPARLAWAP
jgi:hypothetical protein